MNRSVLIKIILWMIVLSTLASMFCLSAQPAEQSQETSGDFVRAVFGIFPRFRSMSAAAQDKLVESIMNTVRKLAHFSIYAFLGFWMYYLVRQYTHKRVLELAVLFSAAYAASDEFHQRFVPGRSGELRDVLIDSSGALVGAAIAMALVLICQIINNKRQKQR